MQIVVRFDVNRRVSALAGALAGLEDPVPWLKRWAAAGTRYARESARARNYREIARSIRTGAIDSYRQTIEARADAVHAAQRNFGGVISAPRQGGLLAQLVVSDHPDIEVREGKDAFRGRAGVRAALFRPCQRATAARLRPEGTEGGKGRL